MLTAFLFLLMNKLGLPSDVLWALVLTIPADLLLLTVAGLIFGLSFIRSADAVAEFPERMPLRCVS